MAAVAEEVELVKAARVRVPEFVYCITHTTVHEATTDPYDEGRPTCTEEQGYGEPSPHRLLTAAMRAGDPVLETASGDTVL